MLQAILLSSIETKYEVLKVCAVVSGDTSNDPIQAFLLKCDFVGTGTQPGVGTKIPVVWSADERDGNGRREDVQMVL